MTTLNISTQVAPSHRRTTGQQCNPLPTNKRPNNQRPWPGFADSLFIAAAKGAVVALQVVGPTCLTQPRPVRGNAGEQKHTKMQHHRQPQATSGGYGCTYHNALSNTLTHAQVSTSFSRRANRWHKIDSPPQERPALQGQRL